MHLLQIQAPLEGADPSFLPSIAAEPNQVFFFLSPSHTPTHQQETAEDADNCLYGVAAYVQPSGQVFYTDATITGEGLEKAELG